MPRAEDDVYTVFRPSERAGLLRLQRYDGHIREVLNEVSRILSSRTFSRVQPRTKAFLLFVVGLRLLRRQECIKQTTIAMRVFDESTDFNPLETSRIRVAGAALRERLIAYFQQEGLEDVIEIRIPQGTYVPEILERRVSLVVKHFDHWGPAADRGLSATLGDELARMLGAHQRLKVEGNGPMPTRSPVAPYTLRGSVETSDKAIRLHVSLFDTGVDRIVYSHVFEVSRDDALKLPAQAAEVIASGILANRRPEKR